jgi:hypothetical protein
MILLLALACSDPTSLSDPQSPTVSPRDNPADPIETVETRLATVPTAIDVLFIIDTTCSGEEQLMLRQAAPLSLDDADGFPERLRIGVIDGAPEGEETGTLREVDGHRWVTPSLPYGADILDQLLDLGTGGHLDERPLDAALAALTRPLTTGWNEGFRREGADLHLVFLTDEDDVSDTNPRAFTAALQTLEPTPATAKVWAITGGPTGCPTAQRSPRLLDLVERTSGGWWSVCDPYGEELIAMIRDGMNLGPAVIPLSDVPDLSTLEVEARTTAGDITGQLDLVDVLSCEEQPCFGYTYDPARIAIIVPEYIRGPDTTLTITYRPLRAGQPLRAD